MKLAEQWVDQEVVPRPIHPFHDEVEEHDEVKEAKDGCGGVAWQNYVLTKPCTSNKQLHELAREIRGVEKRSGRKLNAVQYKNIYNHWEAISRPFLRPGHDYFTELLAKLDCVTVPKGETLLAAFERAKTRLPPPKSIISPNKEVHLLASLCRELQEVAGDQPIMLCQMSVAKLFGHSSHRNVSNWIKVLKTLDVLKVTAPWSWGKAARYWYVK
jgi:hypothetical protein